MAQGKFSRASAVCPYYKAENQSMIYCEGITPGALIHNAFSLTYKKRAHQFKNDYCCSVWKKCPIAKMLVEKYKDADK